MLKLRGGIAAIAFICLSSSAHAADPLAAGREALAEDNPGDLWVQVGERLFHEKRGPKKASLEQCDFGLGPGKLESAYAHLPRYFPDTDKVQDVESRLLTCMMTLQGFSREEAIKYHFGDDDHMSNMESLAAFVASKSNGKKMDVALSNQKEYDMFKAGEYIFYRRSGPLDFACSTCHTEKGKRVRLQDLPDMNDPQEIRAVVAGWPAYLGTKSRVLTMQARLYECVWQMRMPDLGYLSDMSIALTTYLNHKGNGAVIKAPGVRR
jgi:sulfur-oxidizing protein SoxA